MNIRIVLFLLMSVLISLGNTSYAAFPAQAHQNTETINLYTPAVAELHKNTAPSAPKPAKVYRDAGIGFSIAAFACAIVGFFVAGIILGAAAIVFGVIGMKKSLRGLALAGIILGIVDIVGALIVINNMN